MASAAALALSRPPSSALCALHIALYGLEMFQPSQFHNVPRSWLSLQPLSHCTHVVRSGVITVSFWGSYEPDNCTIVRLLIRYRASSNPRLVHRLGLASNTLSGGSVGMLLLPADSSTH